MGLGLRLGLGVPLLPKRKVVIKAKVGSPLVSLSERLKDGSVNSRGSVLMLGKDDIGGSVLSICGFILEGSEIFGARKHSSVLAFLHCMRS